MNHVEFAFEHPVRIPNVTTANGNAFNQHFNISRIELYTNSKLTIYDRWGKEVYHAVNYKNDWSAEGLGAGVYFYVLYLRKNNRIYKGCINILK